jgi:uncharacterized RDD family membrane protein YckC
MFLADVSIFSAIFLLLLIIVALIVTSNFRNWIFEPVGVVIAMVLWGSIAYRRFCKKP